MPRRSRGSVATPWRGAMQNFRDPSGPAAENAAQSNPQPRTASSNGKQENPRRGRGEDSGPAPIERHEDFLELPLFERTVITGHVAPVTTRIATLPMTSRDSPVRPCVPMTMRSVFFVLASRRIWSAA